MKSDVTRRREGAKGETGARSAAAIETVRMDERMTDSQGAGAWIAGDSGDGERGVWSVVRAETQWGGGDKCI